MASRSSGGELDRSDVLDRVDVHLFRAARTLLLPPSLPPSLSLSLSLSPFPALCVMLMRHSTRDPGQQPFTFSVGIGEVIPGWFGSSEAQLIFPVPQYVCISTHCTHAHVPTGYTNDKHTVCIATTFRVCSLQTVHCVTITGRKGLLQRIDISTKMIPVLRH